MAEKQGFEPWVPCDTTVFKTVPFDHSGISPHLHFLMNFNKKYMAPPTGFEPVTKWLTAIYSTTELRRNIVLFFYCVCLSARQII